MDLTDDEHVKDPHLRRRRGAGEDALSAGSALTVAPGGAFPCRMTPAVRLEPIGPQIATPCVIMHGR
ncbi:hypothetical protein Ari01nite_24520 [Paractinoplanes rishiriensis]|uniref:Uncharacterized protein n=1 Tax=Paractinoplanes rishiriensis TaxID=1050105 RepID=A0A919N0E1_9ACTN|nr:hypothetical protein Ari01nite_24520 [Actinoplanes rishiriensis]